MHSFSTDQGNRHRRYILIGIVGAAISLWITSHFGTIRGLTAGLVSTGIYVLFSKVVWKWKPLHQIDLIQIPDLNGTWEGYLYSSEDAEDIPDEAIVTTGKQLEEKVKIKTTIEIEQTWDEILVSLDGAESPSHSHSASILVDEKAWPTLSYNYLNEGGKTRDDVKPHYGSATLEYYSENDKLEGQYVNRPDHRGTHGIMELYRVD